MESTTKVLRFTKKTWNQPIVCKLASEYGLTFNILKAFILPRQEGRMVLEIIGEKEQRKKGLQYLRQCGVRVEPIESGIEREETLCVHCGACTGLCPTHALFVDRPSMRVQFDPTLCIACGWCTKGCPTRALRLKVNDLI
jgi:ferredoxin